MDDEFTIDYSLLPPDLKVRIWILSLDADTSKVNLKYAPDGALSLTYGFTYNYGGSVDAFLKAPQASYKLGFNPSSGTLAGSAVFKGFRFGVSSSVSAPKFAASVGYGQALLPFPSELSDTFNSAHTGLQSVIGNVQAYPDNPLRWYDLDHNDAAAIKKAIKAGQAIAKHGKETADFGAGIKLNYSREAGLLIMLGAQVSFR